ncbi:MAG: Spy/CpxP family protein refolding chaperone [Sterolibacterium sp.]|nr:Spy/CpxP family protein refolding chaperone [Sterolibacterium sp.]
MVIAGICLVSAGYACAADVPQPTSMKGAVASHHAMPDPAATAQQRLDTLGKKLNLKASQQEAWKTFSANMTKLAQEHAQEMGKHSPAERAKFKELSAPDKLEAMATTMHQHADNLSKLAGDTRPFYDQLSPEQKTIFDLYAKNAWHERMQHRMQQRMR